MTKPFVGYRCWDHERIGVVINKEALSVDRPYFLATHVPMRRITYERSPQQIHETSEASLLDELNRAAIGDEHVFTVIKGIPGTGKSHIIRWLKEQYAIAHPGDAVLLIARANTSLRATIQQIIDSRIFDLDTLPEQLKRLQGAVNVLSQDTLAEKLLNGLQVATHISNWDDVQHHLGSLHRRVTLVKIERFLLDHNVREVLKRESGPIERITSFLSAGTGTNMGVDRLPGFEATDFAFEVDLLRQVRMSGSPEVREFCEDLHIKQEIRESLTRFLNFALNNYAISDATQLAAGDLRTMFNDLRQHLRQQNKNLALFIEDITAFTGIDEGLIEVLITQHKGEANANFCRLISVVGSTDNYYADRFPDNIKERVTHLLTLNASSGRNESDLLQDTEVRAEFAARYLNAMRVPQTKLTTWADRGARPDALPNACEECAYRANCHTAFGFVDLRDERSRGTPTSVGLYPFNRTAINTMYEFLKEGISRTPRSLLNNIIAYVLTSHGNKIAAGEFPPPVSELVNDVGTPTFNPPAHLRIIQEQGKLDAKRLETLFLFWGDRNVFGQTKSDETLIGNLSPDVFRAFNINAIAGTTNTQPANIPTPPPPAVPGTPPKQPSKYPQYINEWVKGGTLYAYDRFADWMADLARSFIDWQAHGISTSQVRDYVTGGRFAIEGQSGSAPLGRLQITFTRSQELAYVLQALADLNDSTLSLQADQYGEHLATLSYWIRSQEQRIVEFVREPTLEATSPDYLIRILLKDCVLLACLSGELDVSATTNTMNLYHQVIASCAKSAKDKWKAKIENLRGTHPTEWTGLMRKVDSQEAVHLCRTELLQLLNRPQGASTNVRYLDAVAAIEILADFSQEDWKLPPLPIKPDTNDPIWSSAIRVYDALSSGFDAALKASQKELEQSYTKLHDYLGEDTPQVVFDAMRTLLDELRQVKAYVAELDMPFAKDASGNQLTPEGLADLDLSIKQHLAFSDQRTMAASISAKYHDWNDRLVEYLQYLALFSKTVSGHKDEFKKGIATLRAKSDADVQFKRTLKTYDEAIALLDPYIMETDS